MRTNQAQQFARIERDWLARAEAAMSGETDDATSEAEDVNSTSMQVAFAQTKLLQAQHIIDDLDVDDLDSIQAGCLVNDIARAVDSAALLQCVLDDPGCQKERLRQLDVADEYIDIAISGLLCAYKIVRALRDDGDGIDQLRLLATAATDLVDTVQTLDTIRADFNTDTITYEQDCS